MTNDTMLMILVFVIAALFLFAAFVMCIVASNESKRAKKIYKEKKDNYGNW